MFFIMRVRVIARAANNKAANLKINDKEFYLHGEEFEVENKKGKELLKSRWEGNPVVVEVKATKKTDKEEKAEIEKGNVEEE